MTVAIYTPTIRYGGIDIAAASIGRQRRPDLVWIVGDELLARREQVWREHAPCDVRLFDTRELAQANGTPRSLSASNNRALEIARSLDARLLVIMQDYIWAPVDGVDRFLRLADEHPRSLLTGACSISTDPDPSQITDPQGLDSIFARPYRSRPRRIGWTDCRLEMHPDVERCSMEHWEANWAAIPEGLLYDRELQFDASYDQGYTYDNQGYAACALLLGYDAWIDPHNHAIALPHRDYFPAQQLELDQLNNQAFHERRLRELGIERLS